jgi:RNA 3'-terminal phosphate cyclase (ATP)
MESAFATEIESGAAIDYHLADQLIPYMGVITAMTRKETSIMTSIITDHLRSNMTVTQAFLPVQFILDKNVVHCTYR